MNDYQREIYERAVERQELARIKGDLLNIKLRTELLDEPADAVREVQQEAQRARSINSETMRKYGLDPRNREHRRAWVNRNSGSGW